MLLACKRLGYSKEEVDKMGLMGFDWYYTLPEGEEKFPPM